MVHFSVTKIFILHLIFPKVKSDYDKHDICGILLDTEMQSEVCDDEGDDNFNSTIEKRPAEVIEIIEEDEIDDDEYEASENGDDDTRKGICSSK